jgi:hypothetical protein
MWMSKVELLGFCEIVNKAFKLNAFGGREMQIKKGEICGLWEGLKEGKINERRMDRRQKKKRKSGTEE